MSILYKEKYKPLDYYQIIRCLDYDEKVERTEYYKIKQLNEFTRSIPNAAV